LKWTVACSLPLTTDVTVGGPGAVAVVTTVTVIGFDVTTTPPVTDSWNLYLTLLFPRFAGRVTDSWSVPLEHVTTAGRPATGIFENTTQTMGAVVLATVARKTTVPPFRASTD
jgi:hypothetical protein